MIFALVGFCVVVLGISFLQFDIDFRKKPKHEPYVIGVNQFLVPHAQWKQNLDAALDKMLQPHDTIAYPEDFVYLAPIPDPNEPKIVKHMRDRQRSSDFRVDSGYYSNSFEKAISDHGHRVPYVPLRTPNEYRAGVGPMIGYSKECEKCLQPVLKDPKKRYCEVCDRQLEEAAWVRDYSYEPEKIDITDGMGRYINGPTFVRYKNTRTGRYKIETLKSEPTRELQTLKDACKDIVESDEWFDKYGNI